jgi:hypothetical protein
MSKETAASVFSVEDEDESSGFLRNIFPGSLYTLEETF